MTNGDPFVQEVQSGVWSEDSSEGHRVDSVDASDHPEGGQARGPANAGVTQGFGGREGGSPSAEDGGYLRDGPPPRISRDGEIASEGLLRAFEAGDPVVAFEAATRLIEAHKRLFEEAAGLRFKLNFGSEVCDRCEGLKTGPGVIATCFQIRRCNYSNVKIGDTSPKQRKILEV